MHSDLLTVDEVAEALRVSRQRAYELVRRNFLNAVHIGRQIRVARVEVEGFIRRGGQRLDGGPATHGCGGDCGRATVSQ